MKHIKRTYLPAACLLLWALLSLGGPAAAAAARLDRHLQAALAAVSEPTLPVIVSFAPGDAVRAVQPLGAAGPGGRAGMIRTLRQRSAVAQQQARVHLSRAGVSARELWLINALAVEASPRLIEELAALPGVSELRLDRTLRLPVRPAAEPPSRVRTAALSWNVAAVGAPALRARGLTGAGVVVATMDSGVDLAHPDLAPGWRGGGNSWFDPYLQHPTPFDADGHGTGVLGIILGRNPDIGIAPAATWIAVKIFDDAGVALNSRIHEGFQWLLDPDGNPATDDAPDIVNNSWGFEEDPGLCDAASREFQPDVQALKAAGIAVVFAGGNTGPAAGSSVSPGNYPEALAVGAVDPDLQLPPFSARGPSACDGRSYPDLAAPGVAILAPALTSGGTVLDALQTVSGTSFATPHVAGAMALLLSDPGRAPPAVATLEAVLKRSATDLGSSGPDNAYGAGLVNAQAADNALNNVPQLGVFDPTAPGSDRLVSFGHIPPGTLAEETVELVNVGGGQLDILGVDGATLPPSLSLVSNGCSALLGGERCPLVFRFAPQLLGSVTASVEVRSSDALQPVTTLQLVGVGNTLPTPATLVSPADGATGLATTVAFSWNPGSDAEGDSLTQTLVIAGNADFFGAASFPLPPPAAAGAALGIAGGLAGIGLLRRHRFWGVAVALAVLVLLAACGGGGGGLAPPVGSAGLRLTGLQPNTTYFWKVQSGDSLGGITDSAVRQFTTSP